MLRIAHDLRNIVTAMIGYADLAEKELRALREECPQGLEYLEKVQNAAMRAAAILEAPAACSFFDLNRVATEVADLLRNGFAELKVRMRLDLEIGPPMLVGGDSLQMFKVLLNLCSNGRDAMQSGGELKLATCYADSRALVLVSVRDSGCGMSPERLAKIWEPHLTEDGKHGHGLQIVKTIVERLNGTIEVESEEGDGTVFTVSLPLA